MRRYVEAVSRHVPGWEAAGIDTTGVAGGAQESGGGGKDGGGGGMGLSVSVMKDALGCVSSAPARRRASALTRVRQRQRGAAGLGPRRGPAARVRGG